MQPLSPRYERGEVIVFPTETLYGLGADALSFAAVEKVFQLKGRDPNNPIPVLIDGRDMLGAVVADIPPLAETLIARFWPGPLTIVLPARKDIPRPLLNSNGGIGVRLSSQPIATQIVKALGHPLTATSANPSGKAPARTLDASKKIFFRPDRCLCRRRRADVPNRLYRRRNQRRQSQNYPRRRNQQSTTRERARSQEGFHHETDRRHRSVAYRRG